MEDDDEEEKALQTIFINSFPYNLLFDGIKEFHRKLNKRDLTKPRKAMNGITGKIVTTIVLKHDVCVDSNNKPTTTTTTAKQAGKENE